MRLEDLINHAFYYYNLNLLIQLFFAATHFRRKGSTGREKERLVFSSSAVAANEDRKAIHHEEKQFPT